MHDDSISAQNKFSMDERLDLANGGVSGLLLIFAFGFGFAAIGGAANHLQGVVLAFGILSMLCLVPAGVLNLLGLSHAST